MQIPFKDGSSDECLILESVIHHSTGLERGQLFEITPIIQPASGILRYTDRRAFDAGLEHDWMKKNESQFCLEDICPFARGLVAWLSIDYDASAQITEIQFVQVGPLMTICGNETTFYEVS